MVTHFLTTEVELQETPAQLHSKIEAALRLSGEPLRWAITAIDVERRMVTVEAVVTSGER